jgi:Tlde1 domain
LDIELMWTYEIVTGRVYSDSGELTGIGYSGAPAYKNDPNKVRYENLGPIPPGLYKMKPPEDTEKHGPYVIWLDPDPANQMFGRSEFGIHGDKIGAPGTASEGCIIQSRGVRETMWNSGDHDLRVVSQLEGVSSERDTTTPA